MSTTEARRHSGPPSLSRVPAHGTPFTCVTSSRWRCVTTRALSCATVSPSGHSRSRSSPSRSRSASLHCPRPTGTGAGSPPPRCRRRLIALDAVAALAADDQLLVPIRFLVLAALLRMSDGARVASAVWRTSRSLARSPGHVRPGDRALRSPRDRGHPHLVISPPSTRRVLAPDRDPLAVATIFGYDPSCSRRRERALEATRWSQRLESLRSGTRSTGTSFSRSSTTSRHACSSSSARASWPSCFRREPLSSGSRRSRARARRAFSASACRAAGR